MDKSLIQFHNLIVDQFKYGGLKYAQSKDREATDELFDDFGYKWLVGTCAKYIKRIQNLKRQRDILKIATYCYIIWLKRGFHLSTRGGDNVIDTNVKIKIEHFKWFSQLAGDNESINLDDSIDFDSEYALSIIYNQLLVWSKNDNFFLISEDSILAVYGICYQYWYKEFYLTGQAGKDTDTWVEKEKVQ